MQHNSLDPDAWQRKTPPGVKSASIEAAEREVAAAQAALAANLKQATRAGRALADRVAHGVRPALIGLAVVGGIALAVALVRGSRRAPRPAFRQSLEPGRPSFLWELGRVAIVTLATSAGRELAQGILHPADEDRPEPKQLGPALDQHVAGES